MRSSSLARRLAVATAATTLLLIVAGGLVTNTGAGLAVPDWPTTFGYNMFTYPWSAMVGGVFYEHSHRLLGSLVGLLTLALAAALWPLGGRLRVLGLVAVASVILQGVLGGLRVTLLELRLAIVHGCLAQAYFALVVAIAVLAWPRAAETSDGLARDEGLATLTSVAAALVYVQIVFGALLTHTGRLHLHLIGALAVFALVPIVTARARRTGDALARTTSIALLALLGVQLVLGAGAWVGRFTDVVFPGGTTTGLALPVLHRLVGSLILGASTVLVLRVRLGGRAARASGGVPRLAPAGRSAT
ncbi:MAG: COX15/CtaA family protein [Candidatus Rokubacteria bacterium]|nr:COX15/CtaA family protein [Candidatus Rokubacteria bacterium]